MRISDWSSDVCSSDLGADDLSLLAQLVNDPRAAIASTAGIVDGRHLGVQSLVGQRVGTGRAHAPLAVAAARHLQHAAKPTDGVLVAVLVAGVGIRSEEHTSELQSLMRISYAVFCLKKKKQQTTKTTR